MVDQTATNRPVTSMIRRPADRPAPNGRDDSAAFPDGGADDRADDRGGTGEHAEGQFADGVSRADRQALPEG